MKFRSASDILPDLATLIGPRIRRTVPETAAAIVRVATPSGAVDLWDPTLTPYMIEPMEMLESYAHKAVVFVGPAQCGKTNALIDCWLAHVATASPSKMLIIQSTQANARDYERDNYRPLKRHSPEIASAILPGGHSDNTYDKLLRTGQAILFRYPSENVIQGKATPRIAVTDMDRIPENIGGQGHVFDLALKRARTFHHRGTVLAESSPGYEQSDPHWRPATQHQAPPARGICSLYNIGDRRRLYWQCPHCGEYFMSTPGPEHFIYDVDRDLLGAERPETIRNVGIVCPHCAGFIGFDHRRAMLITARWVPEGCRIDSSGRLDGAPLQTDIASYWLHGVHAAFIDWTSLMRGYLQAKSIWEATGSEEGLRTTVMQDFGTPYISQSRTKLRRPTELEQRKERDWRRGQVPPGVRWLTALVDTQGKYWSVMIVGRGVAGERWVIDRFEISDSQRLTGSVDPESVDPAAYLEDWDLLTERVVCSSWPLIAHPGKRLSVRLTLVDSGGRGQKGNPEIQVTSRAYDWWRKLRRHGLAHRVAVTKGAFARPGSHTQTIRESYPDASARADRHSGARGDVPLYILDVNTLKDSLDADLKREEPGPGFVHFPDDMPGSVFDELTSEIRTESGWERAANTAKHNEGWDQLAMDIAANLLPQDARGIVSMRDPRSRIAISGARIDWNRPPAWAGEPPTNSEVDRYLTPVERALTPKAASSRAEAFRVI